MAISGQLGTAKDMIVKNQCSRLYLWQVIARILAAAAAAADDRIAVEVELLLVHAYL